MNAKNYVVIMFIAGLFRKELSKILQDNDIEILKPKSKEWRELQKLIDEYAELGKKVVLVYPSLLTMRMVKGAEFVDVDPVDVQQLGNSLKEKYGNTDDWRRFFEAMIYASAARNTLKLFKLEPTENMRLYFEDIEKLELPYSREVKVKAKSFTLPEPEVLSGISVYRLTRNILSSMHEVVWLLICNEESAPVMFVLEKEKQICFFGDDRQLKALKDMAKNGFKGNILGRECAMAEYSEDGLANMLSLLEHLS